MSVRDAGGNIVSSYSFALGSGFDYRTSLRSPGDADFDRDVDFNDLLILAKNYGITAGATHSTGDFDDDGSVNFTDLLALAKHYGQGVSSSGQSSTLDANFAAVWAMAQTLVPEPGLCAVLISTLGVMRRRRQRKPPLPRGGCRARL